MKNLFIILLLLLCYDNQLALCQISTMPIESEAADSFLIQNDCPQPITSSKDSLYIDTCKYGNGNVRLVTLYKWGHKATETHYYAGGQLWKEKNFSYDTLHGHQTEYWVNGNKRNECYYDKGIETGECKTWLENGKINSISKDSGIFRHILTYYPNGTIESDYYTDKLGAYRGISKYYCDNGQLITITDFENEFSDRVIYFCTGKIWQKGRMKYNMIWVGEFSEFYEKGQLKSEGRYVDKGLTNESVKDGHWTYYDEQGNVVKGEKWKNGTLLETH